MKRLVIALFLVACAHQPAPSSGGGCADVSGQYRFDPAACRLSGMPMAVDVAVWPDFTVLPRRTAIVGIHQEGCQSVGISVRGEGANESWSRASLTAEAESDGSALRGSITTGSVPVLPPPVVIAPHAGYYWRLERDGNRLTYTMRFAERSFFLFFPITTSRTVTCGLSRL